MSSTQIHLEAEEKHVRHTILYGPSTSRGLSTANVLIAGLQGVGAEISKNVILSGVRSVTLQDEHKLESWDLSSNFLVGPNEVGENRAVASSRKLKELRSDVIVRTSTKPLSTQDLSEFQVIVLTNVNLEKSMEVNEFCRSHSPPIPFIRTEVRGLFGGLFCDFGPRFEVFDVEAKDFPGTHDHEGSKIGKHVNLPKVLKFKSLREALRDSGNFRASDELKFDRPQLLHLAFLGLDRFREEYGRFPESGSEKDARRFINFVNAIGGYIRESELRAIKPLLQHFAFGAKAVLNPMAAVFGGLAAQEVVKACSGKFHPLFQFFYFDSLESLPVQVSGSFDRTAKASRYDAQAYVFGERLQRNLETATTFLVGCGAVGCEILKNLAVMGVSSYGANVKAIVTDDRLIEKCDLVSHLLFRESDVGQYKSTVAAAMASQINSSLNVRAMQSRVCPATGNIFDEVFWKSMKLVLNAVDDIEGRLYVDENCVNFRKHLLVTETEGTKCRVQTVLAQKTENYRDVTGKKETLPTLVTSAAVAGGFACLEIYKIVDKMHALKDFRNMSADLAQPSLAVSRPIPVVRIQQDGRAFSLWDRGSRALDGTIESLHRWLMENRKLDMYAVSHNSNTVFDSTSSDENLRLESLHKLVGDASNKKLLQIFVDCVDVDGENVKVPLLAIGDGNYIEL